MRLVLAGLLIIGLLAGFAAGVDSDRNHISKNCHLERQFRIGDVVYTCSPRAVQVEP
jgi:hypothetical protein